MDFSARDMGGTYRGYGFHHSNHITAHYDGDDSSRWLANDCIHPNPRGHNEILALFGLAFAGEAGLP